MKVITHKTIEHRLELYFNKKGWKRMHNQRLKETISRPDAMYKHPDANFRLIVEVKPSIADRNTIIHGIGQVVQFLPYPNLRPIYVIPEKHKAEIERIFREVSERLGLITYDQDITFNTIKDSWSLEEDLSWLEQ